MKRYRRQFLTTCLSIIGGSTSFAGYATSEVRSRPKSVNQMGSVLIIGGGFAGSSLANFITFLSGGRIAVTLIDKNKNYYSCPMSNLVLGGTKPLSYLSQSYDVLVRKGVNFVHDDVVSIDPSKRKVKTLTGRNFTADKLVICPGIDLKFSAIDGMDEEARRTILHGWRAGNQTLGLNRQITQMKDGGVVLISVPNAPYRCPPGPYERACQIAMYLKKFKPRSKVIILDANAEIQSKKKLFIEAWDKHYKDYIEYIPNFEVVEVDKKKQALYSQFGDVIIGQVLNVIPPNTAGRIAHKAGLVTDNNRWCGVNWQSMESVLFKNVYVLGDATLSASKMPKSAHMANQHSKVAAIDIVSSLSEGSPLNNYKIVNACYSFINRREAVYVTRVYSFNSSDGTIKPIKSAGGLSNKPSLVEGDRAYLWAKNIWADAFGY